MTAEVEVKAKMAAEVEVEVAYFGRRFAGPLIAESFRAGLEQIGIAGPVVQTRIGRFAGRLAWRRLRGQPVPPVVSVMVHPALVVVWLLVPRSKRLYVIHDTTPHPGWKWKIVGFIDRGLASMSGTVVALSDHSASDWRRRAPRGQRVAVVPLPPISSQPATGATQPEGLDGLAEPFVLVFGRTDAYKGIDELWPHLSRWLTASGSQLVIAGVGAERLIPVLVPPTDEGSVRLVARYLAEEEVDWLVARDCLLLLPYTSATQSGVMERFTEGPSVPLGFAVGGLGEQLRSLHPACVVEPGDYGELIDRLASLSADAEARRAVVAAKVRRRRDLQQRFLDALSEALSSVRGEALSETATQDLVRS